MNKEKKANNNTIELIIFIICVVLIAIFFLVMVGINGKLKTNKKSTNKNNEIEHLELSAAKEILDKIEYPIVLHSGNDSFTAMAYYYSKNINVEKMSMESKVLISALNTDGDCNDNEKCFLKEDDVKKKYIELFGNKVPYSFPKSKYMSLNNKIITLYKNWKTTSNGFVFTKIIDATESNKELKIYVKVAFQYNSTLFYDYDLTNIIEEVSTCTSNDDLDNYNNLYEYIYTFKKENDNDNYIFYSVKRK